MIELKSKNLITSLRLIALVMVSAISFLNPAVGFSQSSSPGEIVRKTADKIKKSPGIKVQFTLTSGGKSVEGTLFSSGTKFSITTPLGSSWYNGKSMWTYNPRTSETTLSVPDAEELRITNPLLYLFDGEKKYTAKFLKTQPTGKYGVALLPIDKNSTLKSVIITIDKNYNVKEIKVTAKDGTVSSVAVRTIDLSKRQPDSQFEYPKIKYPKVPVIDLR